MGNRSRRAAAVAVLVAVLVGLVTALTGATPVAAAQQPFQLDLVEGELQIRDAEEPLALEQPTTISGQHDTGDGGTGAITAGAFSSPPISFETEALGQPVFVDATFSQVAPGTGTGSIDADGNVAFRTELRVDLHIEVNDPPILVQECEATPVSIALDSVAPWDPATGRVTISDPDFIVPQVPVTETCISLVATNVNDLLAGSGHSLTMTMEGDLVPPPPAGCPTTTDLAVDPATSFLGQEVTLDITVTPAPDGSQECIDAAGAVPAGSVEVRAGDQVVGVADLDGTGHAQLVTDDLPTGAAELTARYRGQPPYSASVSEGVAHTVFARPAIEADVPPAFVIGADPTEVAVTVSNTGLGSEVINARLDVTFRRTDNNQSIPTGELTVERWDGTSWVPVVLAGSGEPYGSLTASTGVPLDVGESFTQPVRIGATDAAGPKAIEVTFEVVEVDPGTGEPAVAPAPTAGALARAASASALVTDERAPTTLALDTLTPHTLRRGMTVRADVLIQTEPGGPTPTGTYEVLLDGQPVRVRSDRTPPELGYQDSIVVGTIDGFNFPEIVVPPNHPTGPRQVTIRYSGDDFYAPSQVTRTLVVLADRGPTYDCINSNLFFADRFTVNVDAYARVPLAAVPGAARPLPQLDIEIYADRGDAVNSYGSLFGPTTPVVEEGSGDGIVQLDLDFGALGTGTADQMTMDNNVPMGPDTLPEDPNPDMVIGFDGERVDLTVAGDPGDVVPVELEGFTIDARAFGGFPFTLTCTPLVEPEALGSIIVAGTTLTVDAPSPTREGDPVTLRAQVAPAGVPGTVELLDGEDTIGVAAVGTDGIAAITVDDLEAGTHTLTARFRTAQVALRSTSPPVELVVLEAALCPPAPTSPAGATVRLMYLSLLARCPSSSEAAFWAGRLAAGASQASVARSIGTGPEAVGVLVDAGYRMVLDRSADTAGKAYWVAALRDGYRYDRFLASLAASAELYGPAGTDEGFVTRLYERLLGRSPDAAGLEYWVGRLEAGVPRWRVALSFTAVHEVRVRLIRAAYQVVLDRAPSATELAADSAELRRTGDLAALRARLAGTAEFAQLAQGLPNPSPV